MSDETKDKTKLKTQSLNSERDGITQGRTPWTEKIVSALQPFGTEKAGLWFTHAAIHRRVKGYCSPAPIPDNLTQFLFQLVKGGYVERAIRPVKEGQHAPRREWIYRLTSKPFTVKPLRGMNAPVMDLHKGYQIKLDHARLPKWFRDMMH